jgi:putative transposase
MRKRKFTESQIIGVLKEGESGVSVPDLCRRHGIVNSTYYTWKSRYGGMTVAELKKLKELEDENRKLKNMYANLSLEHQILKDIVEKKL